MLVLGLIAVFGHRLVNKLSSISNPKGWFRRGLAILLIVVGISIITGLDKKFEGWLLDRGVYDPIINIEERLEDQLE